VASDALTPETARERLAHVTVGTEAWGRLLRDAILAAWERDRARLAEVTAQRDSLVRVFAGSSIHSTRKVGWMEAPHAELRGWYGVKVTATNALTANLMSKEAAEKAWGDAVGFEVVPVRLIAEEAPDAK
jgi:hypothetical protein